MKTYNWIVAAIMAAGLALSGCSKGSVDTTALESNFKSAEAAVQSAVNQAVSAIKSADYSGTLSQLKTLAGNAKLTPEQKSSIQDVMASVQKAISDAAGKASGEATKALDDVKKALPK